jgi:sensor c-di-GMP phosphodiesterase-like protein
VFVLRLRSLRRLTIAVCAVIAAAPPVGFVHLLDTYAVSSAVRTLDDYADRIIARVDLMVSEGTTALTNLYVGGVASCGLRAREAMRRAVAESNVVREIIVVEPNGRARCSSSLVETRRTPLSEANAANATHALFVTADENGQRSLTLRFQASEEEAMVAHFVPNSAAVDMLPDNWRRHGRAVVKLDDGPVFEDAPSHTTLTDGSTEPTVSTTLDSARNPVRVVIGVEKAAVMLDYQELRAYAFGVMALFAVVVMGIAIALVRRQNLLSDDIAQGMRRGEFIPYYQPVINLSTGRLEGCEVLVRRRRSDGSVEVPASFIAQAEADGQIIPMTRQLMRLVIQDVGERYQRNPELTVAFNLCAHHFRNDTVVSDVKRIFGNSAIGCDQLVFEVTERFPLADMSKAKTIMARLQGLGAKIALDDAGTGHSGLAALHRLGMDIVKIDKIFVDSIQADTTSAPIVDTLVGLAHSLGMSIVAEGVETLDQVRYLQAKGVDTAQGYLFAPPLPASAYIDLLDAMMPRPQYAQGRTADAT